MTPLPCAICGQPLHDPVQRGGKLVCYPCQTPEGVAEALNQQQREDDH